MAAVFQTVENGPRHAVIKVTGDADAAGGTIDISTYDVPGYTAADWILKGMQGNTNQIIAIEWDATANVLAWHLTPGENLDHDFRSSGGIRNNAGAGKTGDIVITPAAAAEYTLLLYFAKRYA